jgi:hypothetical protein
MTFHRSISPCADPATAGGGVSSGNGVGAAVESKGVKSAGQLFAQPFDLHHYRVVFPDRWMAFLHAHFRDHVHVAFVFGVSERAARKWWEGLGAPRAEFALAACKHIPGAAEYLMEAA